MPLQVDTDADWLAVAGLEGPVVDPMILRCGEIFLQGRRAAPNDYATLDLLKRNLHGVATFFDRLVLEKTIPVFNYTSSFAGHLTFEQRTLSLVNASEPILVDVSVGDVQSTSAWRAGIQTLRDLYASGTRGITAQDANSVFAELTTSGYEWCPNLDDLPIQDPMERQLAAYILGGLMFGAYAERAGAVHLMQPKRSRLFLAIALGKVADRRLEDALFAELGQLMPEARDVPYVPTFFPYLLERSQGPREMLENALALRASGAVRDYREWLREALLDYDTNGRIATSYRQDVHSIAGGIRAALSDRPVPRVDVSAVLASAVEGNRVKVAEAVAMPFVKKLWGFLVDSVPGRRHRKLLLRAAVADAEYVAIERRLEAVWSGPAFA